MSTTNISQTMNFSVTKQSRTQRLKRSWIDKKPIYPLKTKSFVYQNQGVNSITNFYAGPSFTDSPVPQQVPLPPSQWLENSSECACEDCSICKTSQSCSSPDQTITSQLCSLQSFEGIRLTPLQLIEAVAS